MDNLISLNIQESSGYKFQIEVDMNDTIKNIKFIISQIISTPIELQRLYYFGTLLKDQYTIQQYQILQNETLLTVVPEKDTNPKMIEITIKTLTNKLITINIHPKKTVQEEIVDRIQQSEGIPPDQQVLVTKGRKLADWTKTIEEEDIQDGDLLHLILKLRGC